MPKSGSISHIHLKLKIKLSLLPIQLDSSANGAKFTLNPALFVPIRLFAGGSLVEKRSVSSCKFRHVNTESAIGANANCFLKGIGVEILIGLLYFMPKTDPLLIQRIWTTLLDHTLGALTIFPFVKLAGPK